MGDYNLLKNYSKTDYLVSHIESKVCDDSSADKGGKDISRLVLIASAVIGACTLTGCYFIHKYPEYFHPIIDSLK